MAETVTIATVNNGDMIVMQKLSSGFEEQHPDIDLEWVVLEENVLRQRVTTDIATGGGQFDVMTIGTYEVPIWAAAGLARADRGSAGDDYDVDDVLEPVRDGLSYDGKLYALPFYAESSMTVLPHGPVREGRHQGARAADLASRSRSGPRSCTIPATRSTASACAASPAGARTWRSSPRW